VTLTRDTSGLLGPVVKAINVHFDFLKGRKHVYMLDCRSGAKSGTWKQDPTSAIKFLFAAADKTVTVEDAFAGTYTGTVDEVQLMKAQATVREGASGIVKLTVRESV
jgi:hypothetical protein